MALEHDIGRLTQLGLNAYEAKAYVALLGKGSFSAAQVADRSGVPRQRIYDILASLADRGLAISKPGRQGTKYGAVAPSLALKTLLDHEQRRLNDLQNLTNELVTTLGEQYREGQEEQGPLEYIEILRGGTAINQRFAEIQANCEREILIFTKPPYAILPEENVEGLNILGRHIRAASLYEYAVLQNPETRAAIAHFIKNGEDARFVEHLPLKLVIVDERIMMFAMEDPIAGRTDLTIMVIENLQLAQVMKLAFETTWERGITFEQACEQFGLIDSSQSVR